MAFPSTYTADTVNQLAAALNAQRATSGATWEGGLGADKSALYMADELAKSGITDLSQVAQGNGNIINKVTGQPLYSGYGERTGGNIWSGSYEGGGNTGFGVNFDDKGNPIFFTQGASSSTLKDDLVKAAALAAAAYGGYSLFSGAGAGGLTASELASADMALGGAGGTAGAEALASAATAGSTGLTASQLANLAKAGINVAGIVGASNAITNTGSNTGSAMATPTQTQPQYTQDYYTQLQNTYNQIMPGVPRDVTSNLASWYGSGGNTTTPAKQDTGITSGLFGKELAAVTPEVNKGSTAYQWATNQGGMTGQQYLNNINQWVLDNPNASLADINAIKSKLGVSDVDVQTALGQSNFSDATKYALTHNMGLSDVNQNIVDWINKNPAATNAQIQAEQAKYSVSDADIARALTDKNSSAAQEYAIIQDMGLDQYYKNIANAAQSGLTPAEAAAQMRQYGVSPTDVQTAYSMFAPKSGLTLDDVLAAYK